MRLEEVHRLLDARKRVPFWLQVGTICLMGLIVCGIGFWGLLIPAEKQKMARVDTPASQVQQAPTAAQVRQEEQKREQVTGPQTRAVPAQYETIQAAIDAANVGDTVLVKAGVYQEALRFKEGIELRGENRDNTIVRFSSPPTSVVGQAHYIIPLEIRNCARPVQSPTLASIRKGVMSARNKTSGWPTRSNCLTLPLRSKTAEPIAKLGREF